MTIYQRPYYLFIYLGVYVAFNTVQVLTVRIMVWGEILNLFDFEYTNIVTPHLLSTRG